ncbi:nuclear transport factor 2 family protein [Myceligenerans crystallogenes]|uniref:nuclear transport factor 2 family protein n=1 Tax=Myceligenerans crystallogenes TaxID=316335 RepID=UPI0031D1351D
MTPERLAGFAVAWQAKDLDALMELMAEDCVFRASIGPEPGTTFRGKAEVRRGFALMLAHDAGMEFHDDPGAVTFIAGDRGASQWSYRGVDDQGKPFVLQGCDLWEFDGDLIRTKDAYRRVHGVLGDDRG